MIEVEQIAYSRGLSGIESTSPETLEWLIGEIEKHVPEIKLTRKYDAEGLLSQIFGAAINMELLAMIKRLLCENGWEPYGYGADEYAASWQFKRKIEPTAEYNRHSRNSW